jgi:predicted nucleic acid-binding protein
LLARPGVSFLVSQGEWPTLKALCLDRSLAGNAVPDAWIAACVIQHRETLVTFDRDFERLLPPQNLFMLRA